MYLRCLADRVWLGVEIYNQLTEFRGEPMKLAVEFPSVAYREGGDAVRRMASAIEDIGFDQLEVSVPQQKSNDRSYVTG